jgi:hypothetical protein
MDIEPATAEAESAIETFLQQQVKQGKQRFAINRRHRCTPECGFAKIGRIYVCKRSLQTHRCGPGQCSLGTEGREGWFCALTGVALGAVEEQFAVASRQHGAR